MNETSLEFLEWRLMKPVWSSMNGDSLNIFTVILRSKLAQEKVNNVSRSSLPRASPDICSTVIRGLNSYHGVLIVLPSVRYNCVE